MEFIFEVLNVTSPTLIYLSIFTILVICGFGFPVPEDIILITGGVLASSAQVDVVTVTIVAFSAILTGDSCAFSLGYFKGNKVLHSKLIQSIVSPKKMQLAQGYLKKNAWYMCFVTRFLPGLRTLIFFMAGTTKVKPYIYLSMNGLAALISVPLFVYLGFFIGANFDVLEDMLSKFQTYIFSGLGVSFILFLTFKFYSKKKARS